MSWAVGTDIAPRSCSDEEPPQRAAKWLRTRRYSTAIRPATVYESVSDLPGRHAVRTSTRAAMNARAQARFACTHLFWSVRAPLHVLRQRVRDRLPFQPVFQPHFARWRRQGRIVETDRRHVDGPRTSIACIHDLGPTTSAERARHAGGRGIGTEEAGRELDVLAAELHPCDGGRATCPPRRSTVADDGQQGSCLHQEADVPTQAAAVLLHPDPPKKRRVSARVPLGQEPARGRLLVKRPSD